MATLTYDLYLRTNPGYYQGIHLHQILGPYVKQSSQESTD